MRKLVVVSPAQEKKVAITARCMEDGAGDGDRSCRSPPKESRSGVAYT
nr:hypothetical protein Itr_chr08CG13580 [Ipomoea trifida]GLL33596.1 hypothetical protein Itr_chr08CG13590 [Ipomoea trifida]